MREHSRTESSAAAGVGTAPPSHTPTPYCHSGVVQQTRQTTDLDTPLVCPRHPYADIPCRACMAREAEYANRAEYAATLAVLGCQPCDLHDPDAAALQDAVSILCALHVAAITRPDALTARSLLCSASVRVSTRLRRLLTTETGQ